VLTFSAGARSWALRTPLVRPVPCIGSCFVQSSSKFVPFCFAAPPAGGRAQDVVGRSLVPPGRGEVDRGSHCLRSSLLFFTLSFARPPRLCPGVRTLIRRRTRVGAWFFHGFCRSGPGKAVPGALAYVRLRHAGSSWVFFCFRAFSGVSRV